jgi:ABC-2 type transport system ATP-binding protein
MAHHRPMPGAATVLEADALSRTYGRLVALRELTLTIGAGECVALIGANGSGKSTAVRLIAGLLEPTDGSVLVAGADPHREPGAEAARAALALVPDTPVLYDDLTVRQHLELVGLAHGVDDAGLEERIDELLERLALSARADFVPRELSRGMRQKAQLACALVRPAALLVLDEPVVGLDPPSQALLGELLRAAKDAGTAVLLTTHQLRFADGLADRAVMLEEGEVADAGSWAEVRGRAEARGWVSS